MIPRLETQQFGWRFRLVRFLLASTVFITSLTPSWALAQSGDDPWTSPLNLSHSGVATKPNIVIDSEGRVHIVWFDDSANYLYTEFDGNQWSAPETTDLNSLFRMPDPELPVDPFQLANYTGPNPLFIAAPNQRVFAFWINPEGRVFSSSVENQSFKDNAAWSSARLITTGATSFAVEVDALGVMHFAFLRTLDNRDNPPGIYYVHSENNGGSWTKPVLLYESPYLRTLTSGEAHLSLTTAGTADNRQVYVAWDNRPRKQVFMAQSADGGLSWEQTELVAGPAPNSGLAGPFNVEVGTLGNSVVLVWQNGQPAGPCSQFYQFSRDGGKTWNGPEPMLQDLMDCPQWNDFLTGPSNNSGDPLYLVTETKSQVVLTAWDGRQWSQAQAQKTLAGFEEPEIYTEVIFGCHRASLSGKLLYVVGCDENGGGDVWVTSRNLGSKTSWFSPSAWSQPSPVTSENLEIDTIRLVATGDDLIHGFFSQREERAIYYTYWNGKLWSRITPVLQLPEGGAGLPAVVTGPDNELFLFVPNNRGGLYFSRATSDSAAFESGWAPITRLEIGHDGEIGAVDAAEGADGSLSVVYSVPLNEERGIYLVQSKDNGTSWSEPLQVFNGATAGFDVVGVPSLVTSDNGFVHIIWKEQSIQGNGVSESLSLYYTRSEDGGRTFSDPELLLEDPAAWQEIVTDGKGNLHILWQQQDSMTTIWDQVSRDGGRSWQVAQGLPVEGTAVSMMEDPAGQLHVLSAGAGSLVHWLWEGSRWKSETPLHWTLASQDKASVELLAVTANKKGEMVIVMAVPTGAGNTTAQVLLYSTHVLESVRQPPGVQPTQTRQPPTQIPATPTPRSLPTATGTIEVELTNAQGRTDPNEISGGMSPVTITLIPVAILLLSVLGIVARRANRNKDQ
jgi:hypothetical protein